MRSPDIIVAGAGLIGMACALECRRRGLHPLLVERGQPGREAAWAAAGMLAARDPANPPELLGIAGLSIALYPDFLLRLWEESGQAVPIETEWTLERDAEPDPDRVTGQTQEHGIAEGFPALHLPGLRGEGFRAVREQSLDPRRLVAALQAAVLSSEIPILQGTRVVSFDEDAGGVTVQTEAGSLAAGSFLDCTGAWSVAARPAKGQMLRVMAPDALAAPGHGNVVVRTGDIYLVPRLDGTVVIGATVEDAGFDKAVSGRDLDGLRMRAAALLPAIADAPEVESWAGLRPDTADHLPSLGRTGMHSLVAAGHFRNGVLLAPATAHLVAQLLLGEPMPVDLGAFSPGRFEAAPAQPAEGVRTIFAQT